MLYLKTHEFFEDIYIVLNFGITGSRNILEDPVDQFFGLRK